MTAVLSWLLVVVLVAFAMVAAFAASHALGTSAAGLL